MRGLPFVAGHGVHTTKGGHEGGHGGPPLLLQSRAMAPTPASPLTEAPAPGAHPADAPTARPLPKPLAAALDAYLRYLKGVRNASPYTVRNYGAEIGEALRWLVGSGARSWADIDRPRLRAMLAAPHIAALAPASVARRISELRAFGRYLVREQRLPSDPFRGMRAPKLAQHLPRVLSVEEVLALLDAPPPDGPRGLRDRAVLETLYGGGLRIAELVRLDVGAVDVAGRQMRVFGKGSRERMALFGAPWALAMTRYLAAGRPWLAKQAGQTARPSDAVFLNRRGARLGPRSVQRLVAAYGRAIGRDDITPHVLRHSFATHLMDGGADLRCVQELLGHKNLQTTQIYTHVSQTQVRDALLTAHPRAGRARPPAPAGTQPPR